MPKILEEYVSGLMKGNVPKQKGGSESKLSRAYAVATSALQRQGKMKRGSQELTKKGEMERGSQNLTKKGEKWSKKALDTSSVVRKGEFSR